MAKRSTLSSFYPVTAAGPSRIHTGVPFYRSFLMAIDHQRPFSEDNTSLAQCKGACAIECNEVGTQKKGPGKIQALLNKSTSTK